MTTITLPPDIELPLAEAARQQGTTPEILALDSLRKLFPPASPNGNGGTLHDFLGSHIGTLSGSEETLSEHCGQRFGDELAEKHQRGQS